MRGKYRNYKSFHILILLFISSFLLSPLGLLAQSPNGNVCDTVNCGQGKCVASAANDSFLGLQTFDCVCNQGWKQMQVGPITFPACTIPNCTVNYECGNGSSPPPPPPPPPLANAPPFNIFNPCTLVWCGDGSCVVDGIGYHCKCNEGSTNLFNLTGAACFQQCYLGTDCNGVTLGPPSPPGNSLVLSPQSPPQPPGSNHAPNCSPRFGKVAALSLCLILLVGSNLTWR